MAISDLEKLNIDPEKAQAVTDFLESYANTTARELENLQEFTSLPALAENLAGQFDVEQTLTMDMASALREAASWAVYFDIARALDLLSRAGSLYQDAGLAFGSFLLTIAGRPPMDELPRDAAFLAQIHGQGDAIGSAEIPNSLYHPQQQAYLVLACAGMTDRLATTFRASPERDDTHDYQQVLHEIVAGSPNLQGVLPFGSLGTPVRVAWDIGLHLLQADNPASLEIVARHLTMLCRRYAETMSLATVNDYLWDHAAAPVDVGDIEVMGIAALSASHFGGERITNAVYELGLDSGDISFIPFKLGLDMSERSAGQGETRQSDL
jgi:hypothetical protein